MIEYFDLDNKPVKPIVDKGYKVVLIENRIDNKGYYAIEKTAELTEIEQLKQQLTNTDYKAIKYAEGQISEQEYAETKLQRQQWRERINELEAELEV